MHESSPEHSEAFWSILQHSGAFWCIPEHSKAFYSILEHSGVFQTTGDRSTKTGPAGQHNCARIAPNFGDWLLRVPEHARAPLPVTLPVLAPLAAPASVLVPAGSAYYC